MSKVSILYNLINYFVTPPSAARVTKLRVIHDATDCLCFNIDNYSTLINYNGIK